MQQRIDKKNCISLTRGKNITVLSTIIEKCHTEKSMIWYNLKALFPLKTGDGFDNSVTKGLDHGIKIPI